MEKELKFPEGFFWGSSTASYQVEGGIENNDWAEAARQGRVPVCGKATDHYHFYEKDFDIAKSLGHNAHRFSIEWARIEPEEGKFSQEGIEHYRKVIAALKQKGIEPFPTLYHWTLPLWFVERGSWLAKDSPEIFARFVEKVAGEYKDDIAYWITLNEPMVYASNAFLKGKFPPFKMNFFTFMKVVGKLVTSHNLAYQKIKNISPGAMVGIAKHNINFEANWNPLNRLLSSFLIWFWNHRFLIKISKYQDFIGLNHYIHRKFGDSHHHELTEMGWEIFPQGIFNVLMELRRYNKPVIVTESGLADAADVNRSKYIKDYLYWVNRAINDGVDVRGYLYWSLMDNYEWAHGFEKRFGLVEIDYDSLERKIRPSAYDYAEICKNNSLTVSE